MANPVPSMTDVDPVGEVADQINAQAAGISHQAQQSVITPAPDFSAAPSSDGGSAPSTSDGKVVGSMPTDPAMKAFFDQTAAQQNVPVNILMAIAQQESNYNPHAVGPTTQWGSAGGMMQYLQGTAQDKGINPFDWKQAVTQAAKDYAARIQSGDTPLQAVQAHFAGDGRSEWGPKTAQYGRDVMQRARDILSQYRADQAGDAAQAMPTPNAQPIPQPGQDMTGTPAGTPAPTGSLLADTGKMAAGGALKGIGAIATGVGTALDAVPTDPVSAAMNWVFGAPPKTPDGQKLGDGVTALGTAVQNSISDAAKASLAGSQPSGSLDPSTWSAGSDPSLRGYMLMGANILGQAAPMIAGSLVTGGSAVVGGALGGATAGGAAVQQAHDTIQEMAKQGTLATQSTYYQQLIAKGVKPADAVQQTADAAGRWAFIAAAPIGVLGGAVTAKVVSPASELASTLNRAGRTVARAGIGATEGGAQGAAQQVATNQGTNQGAGTNIPVTQGAGGAAIQGALGGAAMGAVAGAASKRAPTDQPFADPNAPDGGSPNANLPPSPPNGAPGLPAPSARESSPGRAPESAVSHPPAPDGFKTVPVHPAPDGNGMTNLSDADYARFMQGLGPEQEATPSGAPAPALRPTDTSAGAVSRAVNAGPQAASQQAFEQAMANKQTPTVTAIGGLGGAVHGTLESYQGNPKGGWQATIADADGELHHFSDQDGVTISPAGAALAAPATAPKKGTPAGQGDMLNGASKPQESDAQRVVPEVQGDLAAQLAAIKDPSSSKNAMLIPPGTPTGGLDLSKTMNVRTSKGVFVTTDAGLAATARQNAQTMTDAQMGQLLGYTSQKDQSDGTVVQAHDAQGNVVHQEATNQANLPQAVARAHQMAPTGGHITTTTADQVLSARQQNMDDATIGSLTLPQAQDRLKYLRDQAVGPQGSGWTAPLTQARDRVNQRIEQLGGKVEDDQGPGSATVGAGTGRASSAGSNGKAEAGDAAGGSGNAPSAAPGGDSASAPASGGRTAVSGADGSRQPAVSDVADQQITGFKTSKGSTYVLHPDGTTTRDKAYRPEHGPNQQGPQPRSQKTFYVDQNGANALSAFQARGQESKSIQVSDNGVYAAMRYDTGPHAGKWEKRTLTPIQPAPAPGLIPVETWANGLSVHFGNPITEVTKGPTNASASSAPRPAASAGPDAAASAEPRAASARDESAGPISATDNESGSPTASVEPGADRDAEGNGAVGPAASAEAASAEAREDGRSGDAARPSEEIQSPQSALAWFGSGEKAEAYLDKKGLRGTHEVVPTGKRFEIRPKGDAVSQAAAEAATSPANDVPEPTEAQKEAGNYQKGHVNIGGLDISIENPAGTSRRPEWAPLAHHYGYIRGGVGADGDHPDVFLGPNAEDATNPVYVVDQKNADGSFDEHKSMLGFAGPAEAKAGYLANYEPGWHGFGGIRKMSFEQFKRWSQDPTQTKVPVSVEMTKAGKKIAPPESAQERLPQQPVNETPEAARERYRAGLSAEDRDNPLTQVAMIARGIKDKAEANRIAAETGGMVRQDPAFTSEDWAVYDKPSPHASTNTAHSETANPESSTEGVPFPPGPRTKTFDSKAAAERHAMIAGVTGTIERDGAKWRWAEPDYSTDEQLAAAGVHPKAIEIAAEARKRVPPGSWVIHHDRDGARVFRLGHIRATLGYSYDTGKNFADPKAVQAEVYSIPDMDRAGRALDRSDAGVISPVTISGGRIVMLGRDKGALQVVDEAEARRVNAMLLEDDEGEAEAPAKEAPPQIADLTFSDAAIARLDAGLADGRIKFDARNQATLESARGRVILQRHPDNTVTFAAWSAPSDKNGAWLTGSAANPAKVNASVADWDAKTKGAPAEITPTTPAASENEFLAKAENRTTPNGEDKTPAQEAANESRPQGNADRGDQGPAPGAVRPLAEDEAAGADGAQPAGGNSLIRGDLERPDARPVQPVGEQALSGGSKQTSSDDRVGRPGKRARGAGAGDRADRRATGTGPDGPEGNADRQALADYRYAPGELDRDRSWKGVAERNVQAVELVKKLDAEGRFATPEERTLLARFTGWGASEIANGIFPQGKYEVFKPDWKELGERLRTALTPDEYAAARRTTQYAHYTSEKVIRSVYGALGRMGFAGGRVLEPGMGIGLFKGLMPDGMAANSQYMGVEYDPLTAAIARQLYPESTVKHGDYTRTELPRDFFDAAIGNPPFGQIRITDDPEYRKNKFLLHDYFFAKTVDRVRPGGLLVFVTSKGTMDKANNSARRYLADRANLIGAIRLPQTAFKDNAGTEVVTDVLFLQKRGSGIEPNGVEWDGLKTVKAGDGRADINQYFADHPEMVLGEHALEGSMYRANEYTVKPFPGEIEAHFAEAAARLPSDIYRAPLGSTAQRAAVQASDFNPTVQKEGSIYLGPEGMLFQRRSGAGVLLTSRISADGKEIALKPKEIAFLRDYAGLRDLLKQTQFDQLNEGPWQDSLAALNDGYDSFVAKHGNILAHSVTERENADGTSSITTRWKNAAILNLDAENALIKALEVVNPDSSISRSKLLTGRTLNKPVEPTITSVQDAMLVSMNQQGRLDMAEVAKLAGVTPAEAIATLGDAIYKEPSGNWLPADAYLSGNVVRKLAEAQTAARLDPGMKRNVDALKLVQPAPLAPHDITVQMGSHWVPPSDVQDFAREVMAHNLNIGFNPILKQWTVDGAAVHGSEWSVSKMDAPDLLSSVLNSKTIKLTQRIIGPERRDITVADAEMTEAANAIAAKMQAEFQRWIWTDPDRADRLARFYNEHYNNIVPRQFNGDHLTLPGISARHSLYSHQKRAIWRGIQDGNTYYAHAVGAGKTFTMIATGMEERRLGLSKKPMYVVPNHMLAQFAREFQELYPTAHIMVADDENFHTGVRRDFVARAALNNPDAIIITHSAFGRIPMSDEFTDAYVQNQIDHYKEMAEEAEGDRLTTKRLEATIERLERRLSGAVTAQKKDNVLNFEEMGVDRLFVDELHEFRKLDYATNRGAVKGIDPNGSQKAMDLHMKVQYLEEKNPGRALVGASGTPVTNTMGELFTAQRMFQPRQMEEDGLDSFDAWASHFGQVVESLEPTAAGGYEPVTRFANFVNVPDLMRRVRSFMDILTSDQLGDLVQRPDVKGGGRQITITPTPDGYKGYQKDLEARIKAIRARTGPPKPGDDILLKVIGDGRFSAIDMRFVDPERPSDPNSKLNRMIDKIAQVYHDTADWQFHTDGQPDELPGAAIMAFTDIGLGEQSAATRGFDMRDWITTQLIEKGVQPGHIAFMRDFKMAAKKERLFSDMRTGNKRILIGGKDMETGVNAQKRLAYLAQLDAPWFPASVEQREGRIIRQGNQNKEVQIEAFATKGSYDSTMWGMNARKARFIAQAMQGDDSVRKMEDVSEASSFEMAAALASGDERYLKLAGLRADADRLGRLWSAHERNQQALRSAQREAKNDVAYYQKKQREVADALRQRIPLANGDDFEARVDGDVTQGREAFGNALIRAFKAMVDDREDGLHRLGSIGGFDLMFTGRRMLGSGDYMANVELDLPGSEPLIGWPLDSEVSAKGLAARAANQIGNLDRMTSQYQQAEAEAEKKAAQSSKRIGAPFPERAEMYEKQEQLAALEAELAAETAAVNAAQDAEAKKEAVESGALPADEAPGAERDVTSGTPDADTPDGGVPYNALNTSVSPERRVLTLTALKSIQRRFRLGEINQDQFNREVGALTNELDRARQDQALARFTTPKTRGPDWVREKLLRARRTGEIDEDQASFALWLLDKNPDLANDLSISIRTPKGQNGVAGNYDPIGRTVSLFKSADAPQDTAVHEIMHHTERMLPDAEQRGIITTYGRAWKKAFEAARAAIDPEKPETQKYADALIDMRSASMGDMGAFRRTVQNFTNGTLNVRRDYPLMNPSEFWATNASDILARRYDADGDWIAAAKQWLGELIQKAKSIFGLPSDAAVLRGLRAILNGRGERIQSRMLLEQWLSRGGAAPFNALQQPTSTEAAAAVEQVPTAYKTVREALTAGPLGDAVAALLDKGALVIDKIAPKGAPVGADAWTDAKGVMHVLDTLSPALAQAKVLHEAYHAGVRPLVGSRAWNDMQQQLGLLQRRAQMGDTGLSRYYQDAVTRLKAAAAQGDPNADPKQPISPQEFAAYAIEQYAQAPRGVQAWLDQAAGVVQAWALKRWGKQLGSISPAQLHALSVGALQAGAATERPLNYANMTDRTLYSASERAEALSIAHSALKDDGIKTRDFVGSAARDMGRLSNYLAHPRHVAAIFRPFAPVFQTVMDRLAYRDRIIGELNQNYSTYGLLSADSKANVNKVLELGRLLGHTYSVDEVTQGVRNPGWRWGARAAADGSKERVKREVHGALTKPGETVKLTPKEAAGYVAVRRMFDQALDMMRDQMLHDSGYGQYAGDMRKMREALAEIRDQFMSDPGLERAAQMAADFEQAKRSGYVPFSRYGDYVISVRRDKSQTPIEFVPDPRDPQHSWIVKNLPHEMTDFANDIGAAYDHLEGGFVVNASQRQRIEDENTETLYAEKVETGIRDFPREQMTKWNEKKVLQIPSVKKAYDRIFTQWVKDDPNARIAVFQAKGRIPENKVKLSDIDALADVAQIDSKEWEAIRAKFQDAIQGMSFRKHFFNSDNVPGYSQDFERSITEYMGGTAGYLARRQYQERLENALNGIKTPKLFQYANDYIRYTDQPAEEMRLLRQMGYLTYIAGNIKSGLVNFTQQALMSWPTLSQMANPLRVGKELVRANIDALRMLTARRDIGLNMFDPNKAPIDVKQDLKLSWEEGEFIPTATFEIMATANQRNIGTRQLRRNFEKAAQVVGLTFSIPERINRLATYIAAHRLAQDPKVQARANEVYKHNALAGLNMLGKNFSPEKFASYMVDETQFRMGKANRPRVMRGPGAALMQFKGFMMQSLEAWGRMAIQQGRMGKLAAATSLALMIAMSGFWQFPGADDMRKGIEQTLNFTFNRDIDVRTGMRAALYEATGSQWVAAAADRGLPFAAGWDLGSVGMGNIMPENNSITDLLGIPYDLLIKRPLAAAAQLRNGNPMGAMMAVAPKFIQNGGQAAQLETRGATDSRGRMILSPDDISREDIIQKALGFTPTDITNLQDARYASARMEAATSAARTEFIQRLANTLAAIRRSTSDDTRADLRRQYQSTMQQIQQFNASVPPAERVTVSAASIRNAMRQQVGGLPALFGREKKVARGAAADIRQLYGVDGP